VDRTNTPNPENTTEEMPNVENDNVSFDDYNLDQDLSISFDNETRENSGESQNGVAADFEHNDSLEMNPDVVGQPSDNGEPEGHPNSPENHQLIAEGVLRQIFS
jgi:hypothetical protein